MRERTHRRAAHTPPPQAVEPPNQANVTRCSIHSVTNQTHFTRTSHTHLTLLLEHYANFRQDFNGENDHP